MMAITAICTQRYLTVQQNSSHSSSPRSDHKLIKDISHQPTVDRQFDIHHSNATRFSGMHRDTYIGKVSSLEES